MGSIETSETIYFHSVIPFSISGAPSPKKDGMIGRDGATRLALADLLPLLRTGPSAKLCPPIQLQ